MDAVIACARTIKQHYGLALLAAASLWPLYVAHECQDYLNDDAYISLTYARCLAEGKGFVFNHAPPSLGATTPLFIFLVAGISWITPFLDTAHIAVYLSALCWIGSAWTIYLFRKAFRLSQRQAILIGLAFLLAGWWSLGSETYLFQILLFLSAGLFFRGNFLASGVTVGFLFLTRGEGSLVLGLFAMLLIFRWFLSTTWFAALAKRAGALAGLAPEVLLRPRPLHMVTLRGGSS